MTSYDNVKPYDYLIRKTSVSGMRKGECADCKNQGLVYCIDITYIYYKDNKKIKSGWSEIRNRICYTCFLKRTADIKEIDETSRMETIL